MGKYINEDSKGEALGTSFAQKVMGLITDGAEEVHAEKFEPNLVCIVDNGMFAAAGYAFDEDEFKEFKNHTGGRTTRWFIYPHAKKLAK